MANVESLSEALEELKEMHAGAKHPRVAEMLAKGLADVQEKLAAAVAEAAAAEERAAAQQAEAAAAKAKEEAAKAKQEADAAAAKKAKEEADAKAAKKKEEEEAAAAAKAAKKKEEKAQQEAAGGAEDFATKGGLIIRGEVSVAMKKVKLGGRNPKPTAVVLKFDAEKRLCVDDVFEDCSLDDVQEDLGEVDPRYIFYAYVKTMPDGRVKTPLAFIFFTPTKASPQKGMEYARWKNEVLKVYDIGKTYEVRDHDDLNQEWFDEVS
eukprot:TRINITY_DN7218_c2_g1_i1.p1 TRINITY_DN7218_c2_g1~~TRINITY_DN7218_c2_g1_i1.p1  ORF type:complete len:291 (+),score=136.62 TRINITY_DN7218_c2_g1_i1:79-873(+)